jgi:hypothetical protein
MSKLFPIILIVALAIFNSCEKVNLVEPIESIQEKIVVQGWLVAGINFEGVRLTKTSSIGTTPDTNKLFVRDAIIYLKQNGMKVMPLKYSGSGFYKLIYQHRIEESVIYELYGSIEDKLIYSKTKIPEKPVIAKADFHPQFFISVNIDPKEKEAYGMKWMIQNFDGTTVLSEDFYDISEYTTSSANSFLTVRSTILPEEYRGSIFNSSTYAKVYSFDRQYFDYYQSKDNNEVSGNPFAQTGGKVKWNVEGENVIGLFIGLNSSSPFRVTR